MNWEQEVIDAARNTWEQCASDWIEGCEDGGYVAEDVAECIFDADRIFTFNPFLSPQAREAIRTLSPQDRVVIARGIV